MYDKRIRRKLKEIPRVSTFENLLENAMLDDIDKQILKMHYLQGKDLSYIADELGYSESGIKKRHAKALNKISKLL